jgi:hypothetical protein
MGRFEKPLSPFRQQIGLESGPINSLIISSEGGSRNA